MKSMTDDGVFLKFLTGLKYMTTMLANFCLVFSSAFTVFKSILWQSLIPTLRHQVSSTASRTFLWSQGVVKVPKSSDIGMHTSFGLSVVLNTQLH